MWHHCMHTATLNFSHCCSCLDQIPLHFILSWYSYFSHSHCLPCRIMPFLFCLRFLMYRCGLSTRLILITILIRVLKIFCQSVISCIIRFHLFFIYLHIACCLALDWCVCFICFCLLHTCWDFISGLFASESVFPALFSIK